MRRTVRGLLVAVGIAAGSLFAAITLSEALYVGRASIPLVFLVLDSATGRPISGASIRLTEGNPEYHATTGPDGKTSFVIQARTAGRSSLARARRTRAVAYGFWSLVVSADEYLGLSEDLRSLTMDPRYHYDAMPPPIVIRLKRR